MAPRVDQHLADILESITDAFISVDSQWRFTYLNQQAEALLGTTREVLLGSNMWEIFPAHPDSVFYLNFHQALDQKSSLRYTAFYPSFNKWFTVRLFPSQQGLSAIFQDITERKQFEGKLEESEKRTEALLENSADGIALVNKQAEEQLQFYAHLAQSISDAVISTDLQYRILSWNDAAERLYGWKREEVLGKYSPDIVATYSPHTSSNDWLAHIFTEGFWKGEVSQKRKDGTSLTILASVSAVKDYSGSILGFVTVNRDITASKQAMEQLRQSEQRFRLLAEHAPDIVARFDRELRHLYVNPPIVKVTGIPVEVYVGKTNRELGMPEDLVASWDIYLRKVFETGHQQTLEFSFPSPIGVKQYQTLLAPEYDTHGSIISVLCVSRDVTDLKQLQERVWKSEQQLQAIIDGSTALIYLKDTQGRYLLINSQYEKLFHVTKKQIVGKTASDIFPKEIADTFQAHNQEVLQLEKEQAWEEVVSHDDGLHTYLSVKFPLFDPIGVPYAVCGISTDITERKALEKRKDDFIIMASHELKTPVTSLAAFAELLQLLCEQEGDTKYLPYLSQMNTQVDKLTRLINDVLDLSKIQAGKLALQKTFVDLNALVKETVATLQFTTRKHQLLVVGTVKTKVLADQDRIGQVLTNLIANAIRYSPEPGNILVRLSQEENAVTVAVQDFGIGIPREHQAKLFERYYRVGGTTENTFPGLGMGLYISHEIVQHHGGWMWVDSATGKGSTFSFSLPVREKG